MRITLSLMGYQSQSRVSIKQLKLIVEKLKNDSSSTFFDFDLSDYESAFQTTPNDKISLVT